MKEVNLMSFFVISNKKIPLSKNVMNNKTVFSKTVFKPFPAYLQLTVSPEMETQHVENQIYYPSKITFSSQHSLFMLTSL